jgi:hypothetical protein
MKQEHRSIGWALTRSRSLLRRLLQEHAPDDARHELAERVVRRLEQSGYEIDDEHEVSRSAAPWVAWYSGGDKHERLVRHLPLGLGLFDVAGLQRRHRAHRVLRRILDPGHGAAPARRSVRLPAPMERGAALMGSPTRHPLERHGRGHLPMR